MGALGVNHIIRTSNIEMKKKECKIKRKSLVKEARNWNDSIIYGWG